MAAASVPNPYNHPLTSEALARMSPPRRPPFAGDSWSLRIRIADILGVGIALNTAQLIELWVRPRMEAASPSFSRLSSADRIGISPAVKQIVADANQTTEILDANGIPTSGKGWLTIFLDPGDKTALLTVIGTSNYALVVTWASGEEETVLCGPIEVRRKAKS